MSSGCSTLISSCSAMASRRSWARSAFAGALLDLGAVLVVLEAVLALEVAVTSASTTPSGTGMSMVSRSCVERRWSRAWMPCSKLLACSACLREVGAQLVEGVELGGQLGEVVVQLGQLALLDGLDRHGDVGVLALVVAAGERRGEGGGLAGGHAESSGLVDAVDACCREPTS